MPTLMSALKEFTWWPASEPSAYTSSLRVRARGYMTFGHMHQLCPLLPRTECMLWADSSGPAGGKVLTRYWGAALRPEDWMTLPLCTRLTSWVGWPKVVCPDGSSPPRWRASSAGYGELGVSESMLQRPLSNMPGAFLATELMT